MITNIQLSQYLNSIMLFIIQFIAVFAGVYVREFYNAAKKKNKKIKINTVIITSLTISFVLIGVSTWIINKTGLGVYFSLSFLLGASGNKVVSAILDGTILKIFGKIFFKSVFDTIKEINNKETPDDNKDGKDDKN